jgi:hypothetical protein
MLVRPLNRAIPPDNPFSADQLDRCAFSAFFRSAIESAESDSWVIGLEGQWGSGKSYFLEMFEKSLRADRPDWAVVILDAWKAEAKRDPLITFTKAVLQATDRLKSSLKNSELTAYEAARVRLVDNATALYQSLTSTARAALSPAAKGIAAGAALASGGDALTASTAGEIAGSIAREAVREEIEEADEGGAFHQSLVQLVQTARGENRERSPRVIIIVDDLDRCRPDYTISLIERMKHYFVTPGIVFILAYDWNVLAQSARAAYSPDLDSDSYFRRLIDARIPIPSPSPRLIEKAVFEQLRITPQSSGPVEQRSRDVFKELVSYHAHSLTMRDWQQVVIRLKFMWSSEPTHALGASVLVLILVGRFLLRNDYTAPLGKGTVRRCLEHAVAPFPSADGLPAIVRVALDEWDSSATDFVNECEEQNPAPKRRLANWISDLDIGRNDSIANALTDYSVRSGVLF